MSEAHGTAPERRPPRDQAQRDRILRELDRNLLVEAGAGSGKTQTMVLRMVELVRTGTATIDQLAAVTFTRKAAAELRERFQEELEKAYRRTFAGGDPADRAALADALTGLDRCFIGTIHAFCARLLRERPLEARVPPDFEEISGAPEVRARKEAWSRFLDRVNRRPRSRLLAALDRLGLNPAQLRGAFEEISSNPDVAFSPGSAGKLREEAIDPVRTTLHRLLDESVKALPDREPERGWDDLQKRIRSLRFSQDYPGWKDSRGFFAALAVALEGSIDVKVTRWRKKDEARCIEALWVAFRDEAGAPARLYTTWLAQRYRVVIRFARAAAAHYDAERRHTGVLTFGDLLLRTATLLREDAEARRELGLRYRRVLVDEFQDTDPIQAELLFLLASDGPETDWGAVTLRPGALFLVGDPKQSIYRFRRADIALYQRVKERIGRENVVSLTANFRSTRPIGTLVDAVFRGPLPPEGSAEQAAFAPLATEKGPEMGGVVGWYAIQVAKAGGKVSGARVSGPDARAVATLIASRVRPREGADHEPLPPTGHPGDFLVLTRSKGQLGAYARALEAWGIPVQVSGSRADVAGELEDLLLVLRALADPNDPVPTLACLEGLFFGCSHVELYEHVAADGRFSLVAPEQPPGRVGESLLKLREWWSLARTAPVDVVFDRILEDMLVLPFMVAGELGAARAGVLDYLQETLREAVAEGPCSLPRAVELLDEALEEEVETPLTPGASDAVRVMNLHKAKGLEAPIVILAYPNEEQAHAPARHVNRPPGRPAEGWLAVREPERRNGAVIARPAEWAKHAKLEEQFDEAEKVRLVYVAATRGGRELIVGRCPDTADTSPWSLLHPALDDGALASDLALVPANPPASKALTAEDLADVPERIAALRRQRQSLGVATYRSAPVTARVKGGAAAHGPAAGRGADWGRVVHQALERAAHGLAGDDLSRHCRDLLVEEERPLDAAGEPTELAEVLGLVEKVRASDVWKRALGAARVLVEAPFRVAFGPGQAPAVALGEAPALPVEVIEGVLDLAFREERGWVICDYKTDLVDAETAPPERLLAYRRQVDAYAACWERITGEAVTERVLLLLGGGRPQTQSW